MSGESIVDAVDQGDVLPDAPRYFVLDIVGNASDTKINFNLTPDDPEPPFGEDSNDPETIVILGDITTTTYNSNGIGIGSHDGNYNATPITRLIVESWADVTTTGVAARGVTIYNDAGEAGSRIVFINHGEIETRGDGVVDNNFMYPARRARAIAVGTLDGDAEVVNESDGVVKTSGTGARGIQVDVDNMGTAKVTNRGSVTTTGGGFSHQGTNAITSGADGVTATSELGDAEGTNEGTIDTTGDGARGMRIASNGAGTATATNRGRVTTRGDVYSVEDENTDGVTIERGADGVTANSSTGTATAINENGGTITTEGDSARGLYAVSAGGGGSARAENSGTISTRGTEAHALIAVTSDGSTVVENRGDVTTTGEEAHGVLAVALDGGTDTAPAEVSSLNESGATVTVGGDSANGVGSFIRVNGSGTNNSFGNVTAVNRGTVDVTGGTQAQDEDDDHTWGVIAGYYENEDDGTIGNSGNAKVENSGDVTVTGRRGVGLGVNTYGTGNADVEMTGGSVTAGTNGTNFGIGIQAIADTDTTTDDDGNDIDVEIDVVRSEITAYSANLDDASTTDYDESSGIGIFADAGSDANGHIVTRIIDSTITADTAMKFVDGRTTIEMNQALITGDISFDADGRSQSQEGFNDRLTAVNSVVTGEVVFGAGDDRMESGGSTFNGNIDFGIGDDEMTLDVEANQVAIFEGTVRNVETITKRMPGRAIMHDVASDAGVVRIEGGQLWVAGHMNLGAGSVAIHDQALLAFEIGDIVANQNDHGRITARGGVIYQQNADVKAGVQIRDELTQQQVDDVNTELQANGLDVLETGTNFMKVGTDGSTAQTDSVQIKSMGTDIGTFDAGGVGTFNADAQQSEEPTSMPEIDDDVVVVPDDADCGPGQRGTFNSSTGGFDVSSSGTRDYRVTCSGDTSNEVNTGSILDAIDQGEELPEPHRYFVIDIVGNASDTGFNMDLTAGEVGELPFGEAPDDPETVVIFGDITTTTQDKTGINFGSADSVTRLIVESWADITTSGRGARGVTIYNDAGKPGSRIVFVNHGQIETRGDGFIDTNRSYPGRRARAIAVGTYDGDAEAVNESDGVVITSGTGARGIQVDADIMGTAKVTNRGSVTTTGGGFSHTGTNPVVHGADGVTAVSELGDAEGTNEGTIDTTGDGARGMRIASNGAGTATATNRGRVITRGDEYEERGADGVTASSSTGAATAINENGGTITTEGVSANGLYAVSTGGGGSARAENSGTISTRGTEAHALIAVTSDGSTMAENRGDVTTTGEEAHGVLAVALDGGTDTAPAEVSSLNESGATVTVGGGGGAYGVGSFIRVNGSGTNNSFGNVTAVNRGTVDVTGGTQAQDEDEDHTWGVIADYYENEDDGTIGNSGNAKVENSGDVTVTGRRGVGLGVNTYGTGNAEVEMTDGSVIAGTNGAEFGIGIQAIANTDTTNDDDGNDIDVEIDVVRSEITAYSANLDDASTTDYDESSGIGIFADAGSDANGRIVTRINDSTITADTAMKFVDGRTMLEMEYSTVTGDIEFDLNGDTAVESSRINLIGSKDVNDRMKVTHSIITGDVNFGPGNDLLEVIGIRNNTDEILSEFDGNLNMGEGDDTITVNFAGGKFLGDIDFGENPNDDDRLILDVAARNTLLFEGEIRNLEYMNKRCPGIAIVGDVIFSGSTVDIEEGQLLLTGHLNVGDGDVTIHDQALLAFEVGDIATDRNDHGSITARGGIKFMEDASQVVDIQIRHDLTETVADGVREELNVNGIDVLEAQTNFVDSVDSPITEVMVTSNGEMTENMIGSDVTVFTDTEAIAQNEDPIVEVASPSPPLPASSARGGGGSGGGLIFGLGLVAYLMSNWMDEGFGAFVDYEEENLGLSNINVSSATSFLTGIGEERRFQIGNSEHWIRSYAGQSPASVAGAQTNASGTAYGINTKLRNGFDLGVSFTPRLKSSTQGLDSNFYSSSSSGELYEVQVGWQSSQFFSKLQLSHGDYDVDSVVANPLVNSALRGSFKMTNTHAQFTGGAKLEFGGVRVAPSASLFGGSLEQASHSAEGPVMRADVPEISQRYSGWKLGMNLTSSDWLKNSGNLSWRPSLHFSTMRTNTSGPSSLSVMQSDRAGALSFANQAGVRGMPSVVHALGVNTIIKQSKNSRFNVGYFGAEVDGERDHAVLARYQLRF